MLLTIVSNGMPDRLPIEIPTVRLPDHAQESARANTSQCLCKPQNHLQVWDRYHFKDDLAVLVSVTTYLCARHTHTSPVYTIRTARRDPDLILTIPSCAKGAMHGKCGETGVA